MLAVTFGVSRGAYAGCETNYQAKDITGLLTTLAETGWFEGTEESSHITEDGTIEEHRWTGGYGFAQDDRLWTLNIGLCNDEGLCVDGYSAFTTETGCLFVNDQIATVISASESALSYMVVDGTGAERRISVSNLELLDDGSLSILEENYLGGAWIGSHRFSGRPNARIVRVNLR